MKSHLLGKRNVPMIGLSAALLIASLISIDAYASGIPAMSGAVQGNSAMANNGTQNAMKQSAAGQAQKGAYMQVKHKGKSAKKNKMQ